ncbi:MULTISPECIES: nickel-dependent hydrogenase large subunit [unclassified Sedimentibacter]|uniref:nickel-dependent hydrogenase large subunit n=1 Tax=unclassified Sedimentibacter TaxID=2649220 RepID=UPI0027DF02D2|nr:nickel-dependent hydrogenase large subunit [Sedimentibacter sp. MB35-C1]WMJ76856.1 nickel-dependent hydrogenase large subunit [Sedimentibacter sp. MB35-C1]
MKRVKISPVTRISGFMEIDAIIGNNTVTDAKTEGLLFRGFEKMLEGRSPFDAVYFTQRICGICSAAHSMASTLALEDAFGIIPSQQGRYLRDIIHGCEFLQNHIRHFYQYTAPDFIKLPEGNTLFETNHNDFRLPKQKNDLIVQHYFDSLVYSRNAHEMLAVLGGKAPHNHGVFIGGITSQATQEKILQLRSLLQNIREFICNKMIPDAYTIAEYYEEYFRIGRGYGNLLSFGCFNEYEKLGTLYVNPLAYSGGKIVELNPAEITENIYSSWYIANEDTYTPYQTIPEPDMDKIDAYSWVKAPRYRGLPYEVGPLARMWLCGEYRNGISTMDRTLARVLEAAKIADIILTLLNNVIPGISVQKEYEVPENAKGAGLIDTTRGALGHWMKIENSVISLYQIITPSAWNLSTRSEDNLPGPGEKALIGTIIQNTDSPVEIGRIIRSFDPCVSCATHVYTNGSLIKTMKVVP